MTRREAVRENDRLYLDGGPERDRCRGGSRRSIVSRCEATEHRVKFVRFP